MDDIAVSAKHNNDIITILDVTSLMKTFHLPMYKWATNYPLARYLADTRFAVTDGAASPRKDLENSFRHGIY